jgi:hypothetical protein
MARSLPYTQTTSVFDSLASYLELKRGAAFNKQLVDEALYHCRRSLTSFIPLLSCTVGNRFIRGGSLFYTEKNDRLQNSRSRSIRRNG